MSDCGVCLGGYDVDGNCDFYEVTSSASPAPGPSAPPVPE